MRPEIVAAVIRRGGHRCAWCACKLDTGRAADIGDVCRLDVTGNDSSMVASCVACAAEYARWWRRGVEYSHEAAKRILGRHNGFVFSGPFVDYLESVCGAFVIRSGKRSGKRSGFLTPFTTALARVEVQRNAELDLLREKRRVA